MTHEESYQNETVQSGRTDVSEEHTAFISRVEDKNQ
jgi:hypothetical protein